MTLKSTFVLLASVALSYALVLPSETIDKRQACTTILPTIPNYLLYQEEPTTSGVESSEVYIVDAAFQPSGRKSSSELIYYDLALVLITSI